MDRTAIPARVPFTGEVAVTPRPLDAYRDMFLLSDEQLTGGPVLDCPAGASPFGAQVRALGGTAVSVDPAYLDPDGLVARARADVERIVAWQRAAPDGFVWSYLGSPDRMHELWAGAVEEFAADFALDDGRYVAAALPELPFPDDHFALAVSGFLLFVYPDLLDVDAHRAAIVELARVTRGEVRVFPMHDTAGTPYPHLDRLRSRLHDSGVSTAIRTAACSYTPLPGGDRMLVCRSCMDSPDRR
jgi:hypothetical protein